MLIVNPKKYVRLFYEIQTSQDWELLMCIITWGFMTLSLIEPSYTNDRQYKDGKFSYYHALVALEAAILFLYLVDIVMLVVHRNNDKDRSNSEKFLRNFKFVGKVFFYLLFLIDFSLFNSGDDSSFTARFATFSRPCKELYSKFF